MLERDKGGELASRSQSLLPHGCHQLTPCGNAGARTCTSLKYFHCHHTRHIILEFFLKCNISESCERTKPNLSQSLSTERFSITNTIKMHYYLAVISRVWLWDPMNCSPPGSSVHWIFQARLLEWVAIPFSRGSSWPRKWTCMSCISYIGR